MASKQFIVRKANGEFWTGSGWGKLAAKYDFDDLPRGLPGIGPLELGTGCEAWYRVTGGDRTGATVEIAASYRLLLKQGEYLIIEGRDVFEALRGAVEALGGVEYRILGVIRGTGIDASMEKPYHILQDGKKNILFKVGR